MGKKLLALTMGALLSTPSFADIKDKNSTFMVFNPLTMNKLHTGGGASNYRDHVSDEYADLIGGGSISYDEAVQVFIELVGGNGKSRSYGIDGVTLNFVTDSSFSYSYPAASGTIDTVLVINVPEIISGNAAGNVDIKDKNSKFAELNTDNKGNISIGGGKDDARKIVSEEFAEITGGSKIDRDKKGKKEVELLFSNLVLDKTGGWDGYKGIANVSLLGLTSTGFSTAIKGSSGSTERILFSGSYAVDSLINTAQTSVDTKDPNNSFAIVEENKVFLGGSPESISQEFKELVGKDIKPDETAKIFNAVTEKKNGGIEGVRLIGLDMNSFAIELDSSGPGKEVILFQGHYAVEAIAASDWAY